MLYFTLQSKETLTNDFLKLRLFENSLTGLDFSWYIDLQSNSIHSWQDLEHKFYEKFNKIELEISMVDLLRLR